MTTDLLLCDDELASRRASSLGAGVDKNRHFGSAGMAQLRAELTKVDTSLFGEHGRNLSLGRAVNASIGPALFPTVELGFARRIGNSGTAPAAMTAELDALRRTWPQLVARSCRECEYRP